jgi:branched-chain amino acid transport system substrate-binding protein
METDLTRRQMLGVMGVAALGVAGCGSVGGEEESGGEGGDEALKVGLVIPQAGVYAPLGVDMKAGWDLYLEQHGNKLGGRTIDLVVADEGEAPDKGVPAVQRLVQRDDVDVLVGIVNSATALGAKDVVAGAKKLLIVSNAGADQLTAGEVPYVWRSSFTNGQIGYALGQYLAEAPEGADGAYAIAADYAAGNEAIAGFKAGLEAGGGKLVDEAATPFGTTQDFQPFLSEVRGSGAGACYCFYAGAEAVAFVKQYREFGLAERIPLFGSGFLTEGGVLEAQGKAATGVRTSLHYAAELDNPANQEFVKAYEGKTGKPPTVYAMQTWDAAALLDQAVNGADAVDGDTLAERLDGLGEVADSPRGPWSFEERSPKQTIYLREVTAEGGGFVNSIEEDLGSFGPAPASA